MSIRIENKIVNQGGNPAWLENTFANRPTAGITGRMFVSTDTFAFYRDNGTSWDLTGGTGTGEVTGSGTTGTLTKWTGSGVIGDSLVNELLTLVTVNGSLSVVNDATIVGTLNVTSSAILSSSLRINGNVGYGTSASNQFRQLIRGSITGNAQSFSIDNGPSIQSDVTNSAWYNRSLLISQNASFTTGNVYMFEASVSSKGASHTITNLIGYNVVSGFTVGTNNYGFRGQITSGSNRWNLYMDGTASNHIQGTLLLGTTTDAGTGKLQVTGNSALNGRVNVNGATDNSLFALNVNGCTYTNTFSPTASTKTTSFTVGDNHTYIFTGAAGQTATMENPSGTNKVIFIKNWSANSLSIAAYSANGIIDNTNTAVSTFTLTTGKTIMLQQDGNNKTFILSVY